MFNEITINELIEKTKDSSPNPGGGGISSLVGALSSSLSIMAYNISKNKESFLNLEKDQKEEISKNIEYINNAIEKLKDYSIKDGKSFEKVLDAFKLPRNTEDERKQRKKIIEKSYAKACQIPFLIAEELLIILEKQEVLSKYLDKIAISDVAISIILNNAAIDSVLYNVSINLKGLNDKDRKKAIIMMEEIRVKSNSLKDKNLQIIEKRM